MKNHSANRLRRAVCLASLTALVSFAVGAEAITITYVNPDPLNSRVFVGFANDASGNMTSDLVADPAAASRNDTVYGPLPPVGQLPSFDAMAYGGAELGTNLNAPLGAGVRSVFAPFNPTFFRAHGETLAGTGFYSSNAFAHSGEAPSTTPTRWIVHVDPSGAEVAGTPADVTVEGSIAGYVSVAAASVADAAWNVEVLSVGTVMSGTASQVVPGSTNFNDAGSITFSVPLGGTFELLVDYDLSTSGSGAGANSTSEITASLVEISAEIAPPPMFSAVSGQKLLLLDKYTATSKAKTVLVLKDTTPGGIHKGPSADPPGLSGTVVLFQQADPSNRAVYALDASGWLFNKDKVAKFVNPLAAPGGAGARSAIVRPDKLVKLVARNLGDGDSASGDQSTHDIDLSVLTSADVIVAVVTIYNAADGSTNTMCTQFESPLLKTVGGTGTRYLSKTSTLPATCPVCGNGIAEPGEECVTP